MEENPRMLREANDSCGYPDMEGDHGEEVESANSCGKQLTFQESMTLKTPEVQSVGAIIDELEGRLAVGQVMKSVEDAYLLYCNYAHAKGFSVKKGDQRYFTHCSELQAKEFECSCEGVKDERRATHRMPVRQNPIPRTKCKARLRVGRERGGEWRVTRFVIEHNHEMVAANQIYLLRSSRNVPHVENSTLIASVTGVSTPSIASQMEEEAQRAENLSFIRKDAYDCLSRVRKHTKIENGDASKLVKHFITKSNKEPFFYWDMQLDDDNRVMNLFFTDYQCRIDYNYFGDVLSVDTSYRTHMYNLMCVPFVGINHHRQNVMFGMAFMSDETEDSFEWLFRRFYECMNGKQPETIFSNQCQEIMNVIDRIFPRAHNQLCQWHINQNALSYLGNLNCDAKFEQLWSKCMKCCDSEEEFEETWKTMIDEFNLSGHKWLNSMHKLRHKWATAFSNHKFSAGPFTTCSSKGTRSMLEKASARSVSLYHFILNYENIQKTWRANEKTEDTRCCGKPPVIVKNNPLLNHAADIYTINIYSLFESELLESLNTEFAEEPSFIGPFLTPFKVKSCVQNSKVREVVFNEQINEIRCSCYKFESMGILCKHALKVLNFVKVHSIPERYIKKRWTKNLRNRLLDEGSGSGHVSEMDFVNHSMRRFYDLIMWCKAHEETRDMLTEFLNGAREKANDWFENLSLEVLNASDDFISDEHNDRANEMLALKSKKGKGKGKTESSKRIAKGTKRKGQVSDMATNDCPSREVTHAQMPQEANNVQSSPYPVGHPLEEASLASQSNANRSGWPNSMSFATSPVTLDMHLGGLSNNNWSQPN